MGDFELISFASDLELARGAATEWLATVAQANRLGRPQFVALSGGRIARHFFSSSAQLARSRAIALNHVHFFWADERCVAAGSGKQLCARGRVLVASPGDSHR